MKDGAIVWFTGLPSAGKSTLARALVAALREAGRPSLLLDGDEVREVLVPRHGHDEAGRDAFYRSMVGVATIAARQGLVAIIAATGHRRLWRDLARAQVRRFVEVHVATPLDECQRRDAKGLYARLGAGSQLPGLGIPYEPPIAPEVVASGDDTPRVLDAVLTALRVGGI